MEKVKSLFFELNFEIFVNVMAKCIFMVKQPVIIAVLKFKTHEIEILAR